VKLYSGIKSLIYILTIYKTNVIARRPEGAVNVTASPLKLITHDHRKMYLNIMRLLFGMNSKDGPNRGFVITNGNLTFHIILFY
jgi:hypothetical protein